MDFGMRRKITMVCTQEGGVATTRRRGGALHDNRVHPRITVLHTPGGGGGHLGQGENPTEG